MMSDKFEENLLLLEPKQVGFPPFRPRRPWIGGDLQTLHNTLVRPSPNLAPYPAERILIPMDDGSGDRLWALVNHPILDTNKPTVVLIHGLTGCENSLNIKVSTAHHLAQGYPVVRLNLRGAGPSLGKCKGHYHAGRSSDLRDAINNLPSNLKSNGLFLVGVSLGGNVVLKYLAENDGLKDVIGAASVCAPINLKAAQQRIMAPRNAFYHWYLLRNMKKNARHWVGSQGETIRSTLPRINTVYAFDDLIVARHNGFRDAEDYYKRSSAQPLLNKIRTPTIMVHSRTDPWVPVSTYLHRDWGDNRAITPVIPPDGGHVGFHADDNQTPWHNLCISIFLRNILSYPN
tara:strand:+ start:493 stop:1527 length:1035 start_codon:yes stop_codon:yes gene_type:complete